MIVKQHESFSTVDQTSWSKLVADLATADLFQSYEWQSTWWEYFGESRRLIILEGIVDEHTVGIASFYIESLKIARIPVLQVVRLVGYPDAQYGDITVLPEYAETFVKSILSFLSTSKKEWSACLFHDLHPESILCSFLVPALINTKLITTLDDYKVRYISEFASDWKAYTQLLSTSTRRTTNNLLNRADKNENTKFIKVTNVNECDEGFKELFRLHEMRWKRSGETGIFHNDLIKGFHLSLVKKLPKNFRLFFLNFENENIAVFYGYDFKGVRYSIQMGVNNDAPFRSAGGVIYYESMRDAAENNISLYDNGRGIQEYKQKMSNIIIMTKELRIFSSCSSKWLYYMLRNLGETLKNIKKRLRKVW